MFFSEVVHGCLSRLGGQIKGNQTPGIRALLQTRVRGEVGWALLMPSQAFGLISVKVLLRNALDLTDFGKVLGIQYVRAE